MVVMMVAVIGVTLELVITISVDITTVVYVSMVGTGEVTVVATVIKNTGMVVSTDNCDVTIMILLSGNVNISMEVTGIISELVAMVNTVGSTLKLVEVSLIITVMLVVASLTEGINDIVGLIISTADGPGDRLIKELLLSFCAAVSN